jgi:cellulose synthase/poly-beta-1,6-N-acetylglucosamine synthase-like glycosyltransferase
MLLLVTFLLLTLVYGFLIGAFKKSWEEISSPDGCDSIPFAAFPEVSVIIPARNEEQNIGNLLKVLANQDFPPEKLEIIVVDDHSEDRTAAIAASFPNVRVLELKDDNLNAYKKKALEKGVAAARGSFIVCTDADCIPPTSWLSTLTRNFLLRKAAFVAAPVVLTNNGSLLGRFQTLDFLVLQGITGAGIQQGSLAMANGANLAYPQKVFEEVEGYKGVDTLASGDDFFLVQKIAARYPNKIIYVKSPEAIVQTAAVATWKDFLQQRIRWASKSAQYKEIRITSVLTLVWMYNAFFLMIFFGGLGDARFLLLFFVAWLLKTGVEWPFVKSVAQFFQVPISIGSFFSFQPLHIIYTVITGILGLIGPYQWKGRKVK